MFDLTILFSDCSLPKKVKWSIVPRVGDLITMNIQASFEEKDVVFVVAEVCHDIRPGYEEIRILLAYQAGRMD